MGELRADPSAKIPLLQWLGRGRAGRDAKLRNSLHRFFLDNKPNAGSETGQHFLLFFVCIKLNLC